MDQEILKVFFSDVRCAVVMHFLRLERSLLRWRLMAVRRLHADMLQTVWNELDFRVDVVLIFFQL